MIRALATLAVLAAACNDPPRQPEKPKKADARPRPDAGPPPDAAVPVDAGPRAWVDPVPCPYDRQELENAARSAWGPPPDAGVEVYCATARAPMAAWILWGHAGLDNRFEIHRTLVKASPGHSVLGDDHRRTTDRAEVDPNRMVDTFTGLDLDDDGIDELLLQHTEMRSRYSDPTAVTLSVYALRNGTLVESATKLVVSGPGCRGDFRINASPGAYIEIIGRVDHANPACPPAGRHRYTWDPVALTLTLTDD